MHSDCVYLSQCGIAIFLKMEIKFVSYFTNISKAKPPKAETFQRVFDIIFKFTPSKFDYIFFNITIIVHIAICNCPPFKIIDFRIKKQPARLVAQLPSRRLLKSLDRLLHYHLLVDQE